MKLITKKIEPTKTMIETILDDMSNNVADPAFIVLISDELTTDEIDAIILANQITIPGYWLIIGHEQLTANVEEEIYMSISIIMKGAPNSPYKTDYYLHTKSDVNFKRFDKNKNIIIHSYIE